MSASDVEFLYFIAFFSGAFALGAGATVAFFVGGRAFQWMAQGYGFAKAVGMAWEELS